MPTHHTQLAAHVADALIARRRPSFANELLEELGVDASFTDAVLGDLAEEHALRVTRDGRVAARWWYVREALRSAPHVVWSVARQGGARARALLAAVAALPLAVVGVALLARDGPPARLVDGSGDNAHGIVVNNVGPVQLPVRVLDARGHLLGARAVRYTWESGAAIDLSPNGVVRCSARGDATVRASLGALATRVDVRCRPVLAVEAATWISLIAGEAPRDLPFVAVGPGGHIETQLRGAVRVRNERVATIRGTTIAPREVGATSFSVDLGNRSARVRVVVHEPVRAFTALRADQAFVAAPVRLARGQTIDMPLPSGTYWLKYIPRRAGDRPPTISPHGNMVCQPTDGARAYRVPIDEYDVYCIAGPGAAVALGYDPWSTVGGGVVDGWLALEFIDRR